MNMTIFCDIHCFHCCLIIELLTLEQMLALRAGVHSIESYYKFPEEATQRKHLQNGLRSCLQVLYHHHIVMTLEIELSGYFKLARRCQPSLVCVFCIKVAACFHLSGLISRTSKAMLFHTSATIVYKLWLRQNRAIDFFYHSRLTNQHLTSSIKSKAIMLGLFFQGSRTYPPS